MPLALAPSCLSFFPGLFLLYHFLYSVSGCLAGVLPGLAPGLSQELEGLSQELEAWAGSSSALSCSWCSPGPSSWSSGHHQGGGPGHHQNCALPWLLQARFPSFEPKVLGLLGVRALGPGSTRGFRLGLGFGHGLFSTLGFGWWLVTGSLVGHHATTSNIFTNLVTSITVTGQCVTMYNGMPTLVATHSCLQNL